jgi:hypothetical protein
VAPVHRDRFRLELQERPAQATHWPFTRVANVMRGFFFPFTEAGLSTLLRHREALDPNRTLPPWLQPYV